MNKTAKEVTNDILSALGKTNAPEGILLEMYLEKWEESIRKKTIEEIKNNSK
jgi:hypothetical protein